MEDINNLLNAGEVPNLFPLDEKQEICEKMRQLDRYLAFYDFMSIATESDLIEENWYWICSLEISKNVFEWKMHCGEKNSLVS